MRHSTKVLSGILTAICGLLVTSAAQAVVVNVDFNTVVATSGTYASTAVAPDLGTKWNGFNPTTTPITTGPLVDSFNNPTTVTFSFTTNHSNSDNTGAPAGFAQALLNDYAVANFGAGVAHGFTINGLVDGFNYDLYIYSQNGGGGVGGSGGSQPSQFTITAASGAGAGTQNVNNGAAGASAFVLGVNYIKYTGLLSSGGVITGSWTGNSGVNNGAFNGFQLTGVPEPTSMTMFVSGALLALRRRR